MANILTTLTQRQALKYGDREAFNFVGTSITPWSETYSSFDEHASLIGCALETLGIRLHPDVLPLSNLAGYLRPLLLCRDCALKVVR